MAIQVGPYIQSTSRRDVLICWVTDNGAAPNASSSEVKVGTNVNSLNMTFRSNNVVPSNSVLDNNFLHTVRVSGLEPNTKYFYNVGSSGVSQVGSSTQFFWTAPSIGNASENKRFWVQADAGVSSTIEAGFDTFNGTNKVNGMLAIGDNAYDDGTYVEYRNIFFSSGAFGNQLKKYNLIACAGNHEYPSGGQSNSYMSRPYFNFFKFPIYTENGGIASFNLKYYSWDYGDIHFISLDGYNIVNGVQSTSATSSQYKWLVNHLKFVKNEVDAGRKKWIIVIFHFPAFSDAGHDTFGSNSPDPGEPGIEFRNVYMPLFNQYNVDLCLYGHDHNYYRSRLIRDFTGNGTTTPFSVTSHSWSPYQNGNDPLGRNPSYNKVIYSGSVQVILGNGNNASNQYTVEGYYGASPNNMMVVSTTKGGIVPRLNLSTDYFQGSGIIDITIGGGSTPGSDRLTFTMLDSLGNIMDYFNIDK